MRSIHTKIIQTSLDLGFETESMGA